MERIIHSPDSGGADDIVLVAGMGRSGQTWLCYLLANVLNARFLEPYCLLRGIIFTGNSYVRQLAGGNLPGQPASSYALVVKTHECPDPHFSLTRKVILIVRDPRDTVTSVALRHHVIRTTGSDVEEDAQQLSLLEKPAKRPQTVKDRLWRLVYNRRLLAILLTARRWVIFSRAWRQIPFCHVVKFETLLEQPVPTLCEICRYLDLEIDEARLQETVGKLSIQEISRHQPDVDPSRRIGFRKGVVGDFKNHLSRLELAAIRHLCRPVASEFGYKL